MSYIVAEHVEATVFVYCENRPHISKSLSFTFLFQIFPHEINDVLLGHPHIVDAATTKVDHPDVGEVPYSFVVVANGKSITEDELKRLLSGKESLKYILTCSIMIER